MVLNAQTGPIEDMFNKYSEKEGFTVVSISSKMFGMLQVRMIRTRRAAT